METGRLNPDIVSDGGRGGTAAGPLQTMFRRRNDSVPLQGIMRPIENSVGKSHYLYSGHTRAHKFRQNIVHVFW